MKTFQLIIKGMSCGGCVNAVRQALTDIKGVDVVTVDLNTTKATVISESGKVTSDDLVAAVKKAGFDAAVMSTIG